MTLALTHCSIISGPTAPGAESDMRYTIALTVPGGGQRQVPQVRSFVTMWPGFDVEPAGKLGEPTHPDGGWPVLWIGQQWFPLIFHRPADTECEPVSPEAAGSPVGATAPEGPGGADLAPGGQTQAATPAEGGRMRVYETMVPDLNLNILGEAVELVHPGAAALRAQIVSQDAVAWGSASVIIEHRLSPSSEDWVQIYTSTSYEFTADKLIKTPLDVRGIYATRLLVEAAQGSTAKYVRAIIYADSGQGVA